MLALWSPLAICIAVVALAGAAAAVWWSVQEGRSRAPEDGGRPATRPGSRQGRPLLEPWMVATIAVVIAGLVIAPRLFGVTFLFLPFLLTGRRRRAPRPDPPGDDPRWTSPE